MQSKIISINYNEKLFKNDISREQAKGFIDLINREIFTDNTSGDLKVINLLDIACDHGRSLFMTKQLLEDNGFEVSATGIDILKKDEDSWLRDPIVYERTSIEGFISKKLDSKFNLVLWSGYDGCILDSTCDVLDGIFNKLLTTGGMMLLRNWAGVSSDAPYYFKEFTSILRWQHRETRNQTIQFPRDAYANDELVPYGSIIAIKKAFINAI